MFTYEFDEQPPVQLQPAEHQAYRRATFEEATQIPLIPGKSSFRKALVLRTI